MAGALFQQLYSFVDIGIVGRGVSTDALTAVGITGSLNFMILGLAMGSAMGFCIPLAQSIGSVALQSSINTLGSVAAAGQTCGEKIRMVLTIPSESVGMAVSTYVAQNDDVFLLHEEA